ncbi:hypothetical protein [Bifidobacterium parmae]|uniref:Uncharacterized protein n=1 Tax=Bifidobacterium parmae TaxID=361854 RepID=A0A2N5IVM8_9BIFI|nr:hypothetical protein [Bifidobacterium parmae]PLS26022.1 hypothetical protein Uis4E_2197 [Bifidobacterium parmae]
MDILENIDTVLSIIANVIAIVTAVTVIVHSRDEPPKHGRK